MSRTRRSLGCVAPAVLAAVLAAGLVAGLGAGCAAEPAPAPSGPPTTSAPTAGPVRPVGAGVPPGQELPAFQRALAMRGLTVGADGAATTAYAGAICTEVGAGTPVEQVVIDVQQGTGTTLNDTGYVLGAAVSSFCPQHLERLPR